MTSLVWPATFATLLRAGLEADGTSVCSLCNGQLYWFMTPEMQRLPLSKVPIKGTDRIVLQPHWLICPPPTDRDMAFL